MRVGTLAWRTPTGAMLWELWGRQKWLFAAQAGALLLGAILAPWAPRFSPDDRELFLLLSYQAGAFAVLQTLTCFCYVEVDARRVQGGIPGYLLLKPITSLRLVSVPMLCGGSMVVAVFLAWVGLVWRPLGASIVQAPWIGLLLVSFAWCVQAVVWSTANLPWWIQTALVMLTAAVHLLIGFIPMMPWEIHTGGRLGLMAGLLAGSFLLALAGVQRIRQGTWEGGVGHARPVSRSARRRTRRFRSAFWAQFWLEWRRQGLKLPVITGLGLLFFFLLDAAVRLAMRPSMDGATANDGSFTRLILNFALLTPFVGSVLMGGMVAQFDMSQPAQELPVFVAVRPMTNGDFVLAKLTMAAATSLATWLLVAGSFVVWLGLVEHGTLGPRVWHALRSEPGTLLLPLSSLLVFVLLTWRNLVAGIWVGLTARPGFIAAVTYASMLFYTVMFGLISRAKDDPHFRTALLAWLPWAGGAAVVLKLLLSGAAFRWSLRRNAITPGAIAWISGGWVLSGLFVTWVVKRASADGHLPEAWLGIALVGFYLMPLAELALAPMALTWNRHR